MATRSRSSGCVGRGDRGEVVDGGGDVVRGCPAIRRRAGRRGGTRCSRPRSRRRRDPRRAGPSGRARTGPARTRRGSARRRRGVASSAGRYRSANCCGCSPYVIRTVMSRRVLPCSVATPEGSPEQAATSPTRSIVLDMDRPATTAGAYGAGSTRSGIAGQTRTMPTFPKDATEHTRRVNAPRDLGMDPGDFERATRGLVAQHATGVIEGAWGTAWDVSRYAFIEQGSVNPDTVNPSLWRQAQLNNIHGLFEVAPGCWQARGYDISNITFIEGETGMDRDRPAHDRGNVHATCLALANQHLGRASGGRGDLHPLPHRSLRRCARRDDPGRCRLGTLPGDRSRALPARDGRRERDRRVRHESPRDVPVRCPAPARTTDACRLRARQGDPDLAARLDRTDRGDHAQRGRSSSSTACGSCSS